MFGLNGANKRVLVLWWYPRSASVRPAIRHHLHVLDAIARGHHIVYHNVENGSSSWLRRFSFDTIILHTTLLFLRCTPVYRAKSNQLRWLKNSPAQKTALPQDEYDHSEILDEWLHELGVSVVGTNFGEDVRSLLYPIMATRARFLRCLTGYIDEPTARLLAPRLQPAAERPLDIVYRAAHLPYWFGSHGQLKHRLADIVADRAAALGLRCDTSTRPEDTFTSNRWFDFLASGRATIGCESGSSVLDRRGEIQAKVRWLQQRNPEMTFDEASRQMPPGWDDHRFFALGPRHLEAVITRTCQVLVEGDYNGVLQPHRHYLPLRRDLGNLDEVLHMLRDHALLDTITERAYEDVYLSGRYSYARFAEKLDGIIQEQPSPRTPRTPWPVVRFGMQTGLAAHRVGRWACGTASRLLLVPMADEAGASGPSPLGRLWRPVHYGKIARLLLREPLLRSAIRRGWDHGISRLLARDLLKLFVLRRLVMGPTPDPVPFHVRMSVVSQSVRFESIPGRADTEPPIEIKCDWPTLEQDLATGEIRCIEWDHTHIRAAIRYDAGIFRAGDLWLPAGGVHTFEGLCALGRHDAKLAVTLLQDAAPRGVGDSDTPAVARNTSPD